MFRNAVSPLCRSPGCRVILNNVELSRKYEAIHPEFNGAGTPLKHFIVHYMKGRGRWVDVCCAPGRNEQEPSRQQGKHQDIPPHFIPSLDTQLARVHTRARTQSWDLSLWVDRNHFLIPTTLHNASLHCVGYNQRSSRRYKLAGLLRGRPAARSPNHKSLLAASVLTCLALRPKS